MRKYNFSEAIFMRHGESMANVAVACAHSGDPSFIHSLKNTHTKEIPLSPLGRLQSEKSGEWIARHLSPLDVCIASEYTRASETGRHLKVSRHWLEVPHLNEREWGKIDHVTHEEREILAPGWKKKKETNPFSWRPLGGQTLSEKQAESREFLESLSGWAEGKTVLAVSHGETIYGGIRPVLEGISEAQFAENERSMRMNNCDIIHYKYRGNALYVRALSPLINIIGEWRLVA